ncbi:hypothetical protein HPB52_025442 [Rhipicephalus sanguineus]|uniref:Uncharacterized protein n=1 Tax=Rhipicephalus sanguineus TaxID=34632 RepID=A0A9D4PAQ3_RHISA|nr:hypothetical protein HPB52_025442 [Rhipicephalus sanguineus]
MKISTAIVASLVGVLIVSLADDSEAKLGLALAPFIWAGNLAKDATQSLVAYKLSLATKALAMITGNRSFRATISYDSRLERYEDAPAQDVDEGAAWSSLKSPVPVTSPPEPVHVDIEVPAVTKPIIRIPTLPPLPKTKIVVPKVVVPQLPRIVVPKLVVPKLVVAEVSVPGVVQSKVDLLRAKINGKLKQLGGQSVGLLGAPKYASGYIQGGFRVGHGTGAAAQVQLGSNPATTTAPPAEPRSSADNKTELYATKTNHSRPVRSIDAGVVGRYFQFIQANDAGRCVALMVCSMAAHPHQFGAYGRKVVDFFKDIKPQASSPVAVYQEASSVGRSGDSCQSRYSTCQVDPKYLAQLGESHIHL